MANYNTFIIQDIKSRKTLLVTSSARKAWSEFSKGKSVEVWNDNKRLERITSRDLKKEFHPLLPSDEEAKKHKPIKLTDVALFEKGNGIYRQETKTRRSEKQEAL